MQGAVCRVRAARNRVEGTGLRGQVWSCRDLIASLLEVLRFPGLEKTFSGRSAPTISVVHLWEGRFSKLEQRLQSDWPSRKKRRASNAVEVEDDSGEVRKVGLRPLPTSS